MYVVTFYSFKGGVGRTMALANAAAELSSRGKKVLIVDFDLEAPGLQTYPPFANHAGNLGIVDYVTAYMQTSNAPSAINHIAEFKLKDQSVWLMPAGLQDEHYAYRLNSIDWLALYEDFDGYLMFEDLKQQWRELSFDYVLIDSRTGHTDVGGICTRQLADATVLMFFPNDQNISGLEEIVRMIRGENSGPRAKNILIHFCPSNVPDLDDEEQILEHQLQRAKERLKYRTPSSIVHHYQSMALLDQPIFVLERPRTRLADEYRRLVNNIVSENIDDSVGAIIKLEKARTEIRAHRGVEDLAELETTLKQIYTRHKDNGDVAWSLSLLYDFIGDSEAELDTLTTAIACHVNEARALIRRANLLRQDAQVERACNDLRAAILLPNVQPADLISAIERLSDVDSDWLATVERAEAIHHLRDRDLVRLSYALMIDHRGASLAAELLANVNEANFSLKNTRVLALIGVREYESALRVLGGRADILQSNDIEDVFNFACAEWGHTNTAPQDLFERVIELSDERFSDPNFFQCLAICYYIVGKRAKAKEFTARAKRAIAAEPPGRTFSAWRYLNVTKQIFQSDLEEMRAQIDLDGNLAPKWKINLPM